MLNATETPKKSFWARPEGTAGMLFLAACGVGLYAALPALLAFTAGLMTLLGQTIAVVVLCAVLAALLFVLTNKKFLTLCSYIFKSAMRKVTGLFVEIDPIGIMRSYVEDLKLKREKMGESRDKLNGQIKVLEGEIRKNTNEGNNAMALAKVAQEQGKTGVFRTNANQAGRLEKLNKESFGPMLLQLQLHLKAINKYYEVTGTVIDDLSNEVKAREIERKMILSSHSAMKAAKAILQGGTDQKELFDQAMEFVVEDYGMKMGEIDSFIENSKSFVEGLDIQNGQYEAQALERLKQWELKADSILLGNTKAHLLEQDALNSTLNTGITVPAMQSQVDYTAILNNRK